MKSFAVSNLVFVFLFSAQIICAQMNTRVTERSADDHATEISSRARAMRQLEEQSKQPIVDDIPYASRDQQIKEREKLLRAKIGPSPADLAKYRQFLSGSRTGIFLLTPDHNCSSEQNRVVDVRGPCAGVTYLFSLYSFANKAHDESFYDIRLNDDVLKLDGFLSQTIATPLGNIPIESVTLESDGISFLNNYVPAEQSSAVRRQYADIAGGLRDGKHLYSNGLGLVLDMTYALRMINYRSENKLLDLRSDSNTARDKRFRNLEVGNAGPRQDVIIVFRVVQIGDDGKVTFLWKELAGKKAPKIKFANGEIADDIHPKS